MIVTFPIRSYRRIGEIIYNAGIKVRSDFIVDHHVGWPNPPAMGLVEAYWTGEAAHLFEPIASRTAPDSLRAMMNGKLYGIPCDMLRRPETNINTCWAQGLLVDTYPRLTEGGGDVFTYLHKLVWGLYDKYQLTGDKFTPYWVKYNKIKIDNPNVFVSYYETDKVVVAVVSTYWSNKQGTVTVDFGAFKNLKKNGYDAWTQKSYELDEGKVKLDIVGGHMALIVFEKE